MIRKYELSNGSLIASEAAESPLLIFFNPDPGEREMLSTTFGIDEHTLSSALDPDEVSRVEFEQEGLSLIWKRPMNYSGEDNFFFNVASVGLFLFKDRLVLVLSEEIILGGVRKVPRLGSLPDVMLSFLYETIHHYLEHLKVIKMISRDLQAKINTSMENQHLIQMFNLSESLIYYVNAISGNSSSLARLRSHAEKIGFAPEVIDLLDDLTIECNQCLKQAEIYSTVFSGLMDARGSLVNNNMNMLLKNLTMINVVFLPLNLLAGIGGMSEFSMMTNPIGWRIAYPAFLVAMALIGWVTAHFLRRINFAQKGSARVKRSKRRRFFR